MLLLCCPKKNKHMTGLRTINRTHCTHLTHQYCFAFRKKNAWECGLACCPGKVARFEDDGRRTYFAQFAMAHPSNRSQESGKWLYKFVSKVALFWFRKLPDVANIKHCKIPRVPYRIKLGRRNACLHKQAWMLSKWTDFKTSKQHMIC